MQHRHHNYKEQETKLERGKDVSLFVLHNPYL